MCRNIRTLFNFEPVATDEEIDAAALQYVRKVSGFTKPSQANEAVFNAAIEAIAALTRDLVADLVTTAPPRIGTRRQRRPKPGRPSASPE